MDKNQQLAQNILKEVGGIENVSYATHCMTRLRLSLKDESLADDEKVKAIKGVLGVAKSGGQYQVIVGQNVPKVYAVVNEMGGFNAGSAPEEGPKEKLIDDPADFADDCCRDVPYADGGAWTRHAGGDYR